MLKNILDTDGVFEPRFRAAAGGVWIVLALLALAALLGQFNLLLGFSNQFYVDYSTSDAPLAGERLVTTLDSGSQAEQDGLRKDDTITAVNGQSLAGKPVEEYRSLVWGSSGKAVFSVRGADGIEREVILHDTTKTQRLTDLAFSFLQGLGLFLAAVYAFVRWGRRGAVWLISMCLVWFGVGQPMSYRSEAVYQLVNSLGLTLGIAGILLFPNAKFYPRWSWVFALAGAFFYFLYFHPALTPYNWPPFLNLGVQIILFGGAALMLFLRYRQDAKPIEKGQIKRVAWALLIGLVIYAISYLLSMAAFGAIYANSLFYLIYTAVTALGYLIPGVALALALNESRVV